jgi:8-oxo-dGTP pyrophosphatase MutT (NUDIX family)
VTDLYSSAVSTLDRWRPPSPDQGILRTTYLAHLAANRDGLTRYCHPDHLTASAIVVSSDRARVLLNLHRKYQRWMQFGGHCEDTDLSLAGAALRETAEESGITDLRLASDAPVQLDIHEVTCGPIQPSHHLDVRFVAVAPPRATASASEESLDVAWFARDALPEGLERSVLDLIDASRWA